MGFFFPRVVLVPGAVVACLFGALIPSVPAQTPSTVLTEPATPLLPQRFGNWQMKGTATTGTDPAQADSAQAASLKEDGLTRFATGDYTRGGQQMHVQAMQFVDVTGATAALSLYRAHHPDLHLLPEGDKVGAQASAGGGEALFRQGDTVVLASSLQGSPRELAPLALTLPKVGGRRGAAPLLPSILPAKGLETESVRYALGPTSYAAIDGLLPADELGFDKSAEVISARYDLRSGKGKLTLLLYPTPQIAGDRGRALTAWVNAHLQGLGTVKMRREGPLVLMTSGGFSPDEAQRLVENTHLNMEVTWNKKLPPEFHTEVRKTASLLMSIMVLSGVLMLAAVLLGLFLGGGRALIRVMQGKPAATEPEFLGLGLKPGPVSAIEEPKEVTEG